PADGGAMELAIGAKQVFVLMELFTRDGSCKLVPECSYPVTGIGCVNTVYTDYAVFRIADGTVTVQEIFGDTTIDELEQLTGLSLSSVPVA
ncbi:MAG TPA: CoA-transferase, partial [Terrimesophilobacter sp.]|nr:CoA-transferase [Terrimesophilobacter sp.]